MQTGIPMEECMTVATPPPPPPPPPATPAEQTGVEGDGRADAVALMRFDSRRLVHRAVDTEAPSILQANAVGHVQLVKKKKIVIK